MQIIPAIQSEGSNAVSFLGGKSSKGVSAFGNLLNSIGQNANNQHAHTLPNAGKAALTLRGKLLAGNSPSSAPEVRDAKIGQVEFKDLKAKLSKLGLDDKSIKELEERAAEGGLTWNGLLQHLSQQPQFSTAEGLQQKLDEETSNKMQTLFQKFGFTPEESESMISDLEKGNLKNVWDSVKNKLAESDAKDISITPADINALGKAMQLSDETVGRMHAALQGADQVSGTAEELQGILSEVTTSVARKSSQIAERIGKLRDTLTPAMEQALERNSQLTEADARASAETTRSDTLIKDKARAEILGFEKAAVSENGNKDVTREARIQKEMDEQRSDITTQAEKNNRMQAVTKGESSAEATARAMIEKQSAQNGIHSGKEFNTIRSTSDSQGHHLGLNGEVAESKSDAKGDKGSQSGKQHTFNGNENSFSSAQHWLNNAHSANATGGDAKAAQWEQLLANQANSNAMHNFDKVSEEAAAKDADTLASNEKRILEQLESGMMRNMKNGRKQLTIRLDPPELGKVTVVLSVNNKELVAKIRPESQEAAQAIADQLHTLKQSLEAQGLKVERLDVQTNLANSQDRGENQNWQGTANHNSNFDEKQRFLNSRRLHNLRSEGTDRIPDIQAATVSGKATLHTGLNLVA